jgi:hypothetical protein
LELLDNEVVTSLAAKGTFRRNNSEAALFLSLKEKDLISCDDKKLSQSSLGAAATLLELDCAIAVRKHNSLERRPHPKFESWIAPSFSSSVVLSLSFSGSEISS